MSVCSPCLAVQSIPYCAEAIVIGTADPTTSYAVQFLNTANGRTDTEVVTSDSYGAIEVTWANRQEHATYEVTVWPEMSFLVDGETEETLCVSAHFVRDGQEMESYTLTTGA